jgi:hypothetical protein
LTCVLCGDPAAAVFAMDAGCVCLPTPGDQALCMHHAAKASPLGSMDLVKILEPGWRAEIERRFGTQS